MATIATLVAKLVGDIGPFQSSMKQAEQESAGIGSRIAGGMNSALSTIGNVAKIAGEAVVAGIGVASSAAIGGVVAFNNWADELDSIGDVLGTNADQSAALAVAIQRVGGDTEAITGQMAKLSKGLVDVSGKATPTAKLMQQLGVQFRDARGQLLPTTDILGNVATKLAAMPDGLEKTAIMTSLFGKSGKDLSDTMNALANGGLAAAEEKARKLGLAIGDDGVNRSIEFNKSMADLKMSLQGVAVSIGSTLMPIIQPLIARFADWAVNVMPQVRAGIESVFGWIQTNVGPILEGMIAGFQTIVTWVQTNWPLIQNAIVTTWTNIQTTISPAINAIGSLIQTIFGAVQTFIHAHGEDIKNFLSTTWSTIRSIVEPVITWFYNTIVTVFGGIATWINQNQGEVQRIFQGVWDGIKMTVGTVLEIIRGVVNAVLSLLKGDVQGALNAVSQMFTNIWTGIRDYVSQAVTTMRQLLSIAWYDISKAVSTAWDGIKAWIEGAWDGIMNFFKTLPSKLYDLGVQIITGLWNGIKSMFENIGKGISDFFQRTIDDIKKKLGVQSPSTVFAGIGVNLMAGLANGIAGAAALPRLELASALGDLTTDVTLRAQAAITPIGATSARAGMSADMRPNVTFINNNEIHDTLSARILAEQQRQDLLRSTQAEF